MFKYPSFNLEKLKDHEVTQLFQTKAGSKLAALDLLNTHVDTFADDIRKVLVTKSEEVLGKRRRKFQTWVTNEILDL